MFEMFEMFELFELFEKRQINNKGYGYIATNEIPKDKILFEEFPFIVSEEHNGVQFFDEIFQVILNLQTNKDLKETFYGLCPFEYINVHQNSQFTGSFIKQLSKCKSPLKKEILKKISFNELILLCLKYKRNVFIYMNEGQGALFKHGSIFNHSCSPNVDFSYTSEGKIIFTSNRNISKNEELCISYVDLDQQKEHIQFELLQTYDFEYEF